LEHSIADGLSSPRLNQAIILTLIRNLEMVFWFGTPRVLKEDKTKFQNRANGL
jgi:hypothetical protein